MLQLKAWFATAALILVVVQVVTALWMWGHLPAPAGRRHGSADLHRWSGSVALHPHPAGRGALRLGARLRHHHPAGARARRARAAPSTARYAAKMLGIRLRGLPRWAIPVLGGTVFALFLLVWTTSAAWFFSRSGVPLL